MAYPEFAEKGVTPLFDNMMGQNLIQHSLFAFYLTNDKNQFDSELTFGYYDRTKFQGEISWFPAIYKMMFGIKLDDIIINGKKMNFCGEGGVLKECIITVDSGTSYLSVPSKVMEKL